MGHSDTDNRPLVTVVAMCYNHSRFLRECLDSILHQSYPNIQLIITDDFSQDGSSAMIDLWIQANRVDCHFLKHEKNLGLCRTANEALSLACGKYISGVATDDVWFPDKIERQVLIMEQLSESVGIVYSDALVIDENGRTIGNSFIAAHRALPEMPEGNIHSTLWEGNFIPAMTTLVRRDCYSSVGPFDENLYFEDWDMWLRMARQYEFRYSPKISARYRIVSTSMAHSNPDEMLAAGIQMCHKHIEKGWVTAEAMPNVADKLYFYAEQSYKRKLPHARETMELALKFDRKFRTRCLSCFVKLGIPYKYFAGMRQLIELFRLLRSKFGTRPF